MKNNQFTNNTILKIENRCEVLSNMINSIKSVYETSTDDGKRFIETMIGAGLFYMPHGNKYYSGFISKLAFEHLKKQGKSAKLTKEHQYPRKLAAKELLTQEVVTPESLKKDYESKYAKYNYVLPSENKAIIKFQKDGVFENPESSYSFANIELIPQSKNQLLELRK